jgi:RNA polymerase sigma factor (sigma-70 family)
MKANLNKSLLENYKNTNDIKYKNLFIEHNTPLIRQIIARRFKYPSHFDDLLQEGRLALAKAMDKYDSDRGNISTLCYWSVMNRLKTYMSKTNVFGKRKSMLEPIDNSEDVLNLIQVDGKVKYSNLENLIDQLEEEDKNLIKERFGFNGKRKLGRISTKEIEAISKLKELINNSDYELVELFEESIVL